MIFVLDRFLADPDAVRRDALAMPFDVRGNVPGARTGPYGLDLRHAFQELLGPSRPIRNWRADADGYNGAFQLVLAGDGDSWIHHDNSAWAAVLHLSTAWPAGHGTVFHRRLADPGFVRHEPGQPDYNEIPHQRDDQRGEWVESLRVEGVYNRLVLYDAMLYHRSGVPGFGDGPENGRLTQVWFFD